LIRSIDRGIDDKEAKRLVRRLSKAANEKIDIPYIPEFAEKIALRFVIGMVEKQPAKNSTSKKFVLNRTKWLFRIQMKILKV